MGRTVAWFSAGAASAVATKIAVTEDPSTVVAYCDTGSEHPDNVRFRSAVAAWLGHPIVVLRSESYADVDDVIERRQFIVGPTGAPCTGILKRDVRYKFQRVDDRQVFGFTSEEEDRAKRFRDNNPEVDMWCPLIERGLDKAATLALIERAGIELPAMYLLGYRNNNCIGCVKGGMGYWNKIRDDFPVVFARRARQERDIGHAINKDDAGPVYLDELDPDRGDYPTEIVRDCSLMCAPVEAGWA